MCWNCAVILVKNPVLQKNYVNILNIDILYDILVELESAKYNVIAPEIKTTILIFNALRDVFVNYE